MSQCTVCLNTLVEGSSKSRGYSLVQCGINFIKWIDLLKKVSTCILQQTQYTVCLNSILILVQKGCQFGNCELNVCVTQLNIKNIKDSDLAFKEWYLKNRAFKAKYFHVQIESATSCRQVMLSFMSCIAKNKQDERPSTGLWVEDSEHKYKVCMYICMYGTGMSDG